MNCAEQFRVMAFAQLTWRESLRDIGVTLGASSSKLYAMGLRHAVHRATLADANDSRDWRIWSDLWALLIRRARKLYRDEDLGLDLTNTVYALDATSIDLCLSLFDWAPFRSTKAAVKMHTLLDLRGAIPASIHINQRRQDARGQCARPPAHRGRGFLRNGSGLAGFLSALPSASDGGLLCHPIQAWHGRQTRVLGRN